MFAGQLEVTLSGVRASIATTIAAAVVAYLFIGFIGAIFLVPEAEAPLFLTLTVTTAASLLVGCVTGQTVTKRGESKLAQQRAVAAYVFTNAAGTLTTVLTNATEAVDTGRPPNHNAITLILQAAADESSPAYVWLYVAVLSAVAIWAFFITRDGAKIISRSDVADETEVKQLGQMSTLLLAMGIAIGTSWGKIPLHAKDVANAWMWGVYGLLALLMIGFLAFYSRFLFAAIFGIIRLTVTAAAIVVRTLTRAETLAWLGTIAAGLLIGGLTGLALYAFLLGLLIVATVVAEQTFSVAPQVFEPIALGSLELLKRSAIYGAGAWAVIAVISLAITAWPIGIAFGRRQARATAGFVNKARASLWTSIASWAARTRTGIVEFARSITKLFVSLSQSRTPRPHVKREPLAQIVAGILGRAFTLVGAIAPKVAGKFQRPIKAASAVALLTATVASAELRHVEFPPFELPTPFLLDVPPLEIGEVVLDIPPAAPIVPLRSMDIRSVTMCEVRPENFQWVFGSSNKFEMPIEGCAMPAIIRGSTALVVVGVSSTGPNIQLERRRAFERGRALAIWAATQSDDDVQVFVLDLGMAKRARAFRDVGYLFGSLRGERPVPALMLSPEPLDAPFGPVDVSFTLGDQLNRTTMRDSFTDCTLYRVDTKKRFDAMLQVDRSFECGIE